MQVIGRTEYFTLHTYSFILPRGRRKLYNGRNEETQTEEEQLTIRNVLASGCYENHSAQTETTAHLHYLT